MVVSPRRIGLTLMVALAVAGLWLAWGYASVAASPINKNTIRAQIKQIGGDEQTVRAATNVVRRDTHDRSVVLAIVSGAVAVGAGAVAWGGLRGEPKRWKLVWFGMFLSIPVAIALVILMGLSYDAASF